MKGLPIAIGLISIWKRKKEIETKMGNKNDITE
jgi:hypothetical protein